MKVDFPCGISVAPTHSGIVPIKVEINSYVGSKPAIDTTIKVSYSLTDREGFNREVCETTNKSVLTAHHLAQFFFAEIFAGDKKLDTGVVEIGEPTCYWLDDYVITYLVSDQKEQTK